MEAVKLSVDKQGGVVIPTNLRQQLAIQAGSHLIVWVENGRLILETKEQLWQSIHAACQHIPQETDLAQELIDERRVAALTGLT